jgi:hypothetical protein
MNKFNMVQLTSTRCLEIASDKVKVLINGETEKEIEADTVIFALGMKSVKGDELRRSAGDIPVFEIEDCVKPGKVAEAIKNGYLASMAIL